MVWQGKGFTVILSDMCPSVSGISSRDTVLSAELGMCTLSLALSSNVKDEEAAGDPTGILPNEKGLLMPGGSIVIKVLEGEDSSGKATPSLQTLISI